MMLLLACAEEVKLACTSSIDPTIETIVHLTCDGTGEVLVAYGRGDYAEELPAYAAGADIPLFGMPAASTVTWRVTQGDTVVEGEASTGSLPSGLPTMEISLPASDATPRYLMGSVFGTQPASFVLDREGNYVWYRSLSEELWTIETIFAKNGDSPTILTNEFAADRDDDAGQIRRLSLLGEELDTFDPVLSHHLFTELGPEAGEAAGTVATLVMDVRSWTDPESGKTMDVVGDAVVEITPDGAQRTVFSLWDWLEVSKSSEFDIPFYPQGKDWSHANAIHWYADTDTYLVSFNNLALAAEFRRDTGEPVRWYGEATTEPPALPFEKGSLHWHHQHDVQRRADGHLTAFVTDTDSGDSGAVEYEVDEAAGVLREVWRGGFDDGRRSAFLGQVEPLESGNVLVNYGAARTLAEYTRDGALVWEMMAPKANFFGDVHPFDSFYLGE